MAEVQKKYLYLVQGQKSLVTNYLHLVDRPDSDALFLTYDEELGGAMYFPDSTWAQGRNLLLDKALDKGIYHYYIFCDDDTEFEHGSWGEFERMLDEKKPGIAVPIFPKTRNSALTFPNLASQSFFINDEQLIAFHRDVVTDRLVLPYQTQFDRVNWWISCEIQQLLVQNFYPYDALQFNRIVVENTCQKRYHAQYEHERSFRDVVREWMDKEFRGSYRLTSHYVPLRLHRLLSRTIAYHARRLVDTGYSVSPRTPNRLLTAGSEILQQYKTGRSCGGHS